MALNLLTPRVIDHANPVNWHAPLNRGLIGWWQMLPRRMGGMRWWDLTGRYPGRLLGGPLWSPRHPPGGWGSLRLDGVDAYVDTPSFDLGGLSSVTITAWLKHTNATIGATSQGLAYKTNATFDWFVVSNTMQVYLQNSVAWHFAVTSPAFTDWNVWHHLAMTYNGAAVRLYRDGVWVATSASETGAFGADNAPLFLGWNSSGGANFLDGFLTDVRLARRALTDTEIAALYCTSRLGYPRELRWRSPLHVVPIAFNPGATTLPGAVANGIIVLWSGTNATIPSGWTRATALNGLYPRGAPASTEPGGTGGALTHTHTTATHTHTTAHTHTVPDSTTPTGSSARDTGTTNPPAVHTHAGNPAAQNPATSVATDTPSTDAVNHEPPYYTVIFLASDGTAMGFPASVLSLWHEAAGAPAGWDLCDGAAGRPDLRGKYLKGAATAGDGGGTGGGTTHTHTITSHSHTTPYAHTHPDVTSAQRTEALTTGSISGAAANVATATHTHTLTIASASPTITANTDTAGSTNHEPPYWLVAVIQNTSGTLSWPDRLIGLWSGAIATIPTDWKLCDGTNGTPDLRSLFIKGATTVAGVGSGGGSATHGHTATGHTHAVAAHVHTVTGGVGASESRTAGATNAPTDTHTHTWPNTGSTSFTSGAGTPSVDSYTDTQPPFTNVVFIQWQVPGVQKAPPPVRRPWRIFWRAA